MFRFDSRDDNFDLDAETSFPTSEHITQSKTQNETNDNFDLDADTSFAALEHISQSKTQNETRPDVGGTLHSSSRITNLSPRQKENFVPVTKPHYAKPAAEVNPSPCTAMTRTAMPDTMRCRAVKRTSAEPFQQEPCSKQRFVRKFPGPAGIIALDTSKVPSEESNAEPLREPNQLSDYDSFEISWTKALERLGVGFLSQDDVNSISKITERHSECRSLTTRVPLLIAAIKEIEHSSMDASCVLADVSGEVIGSFHQPIVDRYGKLLRKGSTLLLRNIALLCPSKSQRKMYLSITTRSLLAIYSPAEDKVVTIQPFTATDIRRWMAENHSKTTGVIDRHQQLHSFNLATVSGSTTAVEQTVTASRRPDDDVLAQFLSGADDDLFTQF